MNDNISSKLMIKMGVFLGLSIVTGIVLSPSQVVATLPTPKGQKAEGDKFDPGLADLYPENERGEIRSYIMALNHMGSLDRYLDDLIHQISYSSSRRLDKLLRENLGNERIMHTINQAHSDVNNTIATIQEARRKAHDFLKIKDHKGVLDTVREINKSAKKALDTINNVHP
jgi:hypothetical protein